MEFKETKTITVILNTNPSGDGATFVRTMTKHLFVNMSHPLGFYVKQICYHGNNDMLTDVVNVDQKTGTIEAKATAGDTASYPIRYVEPATYTLHTSLVNDDIGCFIDGTSASPNTYFALNGDNINGDFIFTINDEVASPSTVATGVVCLVLQFVK